MQVWEQGSVFWYLQALQVNTAAGLDGQFGRFALESAMNLSGAARGAGSRSYARIWLSVLSHQLSPGYRSNFALALVAASLERSLISGTGRGHDRQPRMMRASYVSPFQYTRLAGRTDSPAASRIERTAVFLPNCPTA
jgi:hypothetical protein